VNLGITPSQTVGPFLAIGLPWPDGPAPRVPRWPDSVDSEGPLLGSMGPTRSARCGRVRCQLPAADWRPRTSTCRSSPADCLTAS
jgi:hypothetical protein